jgi:hypothetical protein
MKVLDLQCQQGHSFEGWFGSQDDYDAQRSRRLVTCPICNDSDIVKMLSAPRLNLGHSAEPSLAASQSDTSSLAPAESDASGAGSSRQELPLDTHALQEIQANMLKMVRHVMANTEDVGSRFAEEARRIHYGEREERNIRGQATREETEALLEEGIDVVPLPLPESLKDPLQ